MNMNVEDYYNKVYAADKNSHFLKYRNGRTLAEEHEWALDWIRHESPCRDLILDFGCGEGDFLMQLGRFEQRIGIDQCERALNNADGRDDHIDFIQGEEDALDVFFGQCDVVTSFGTLEHLADPQATLMKLLACLKDEGTLMVSCPSFLNVRGIIWMTLTSLFDVPMSLSDQHFISPADMKLWLKGSGRSLQVETFDHDVGLGDYFVKDMTKRLYNALRDANYPNGKIARLLSWVMVNKEYFATNAYSGANALYIIR